MSEDEATTDPHGPADDEAGSAASGRANLAAQLRQLEDFAARTTSEGDSVPPQAMEMIVHLREIVRALDGLTASMAERPMRDDRGSPDAPDPAQRAEGDPA